MKKFCKLYFLVVILVVCLLILIEAEISGNSSNVENDVLGRSEAKNISNEESHGNQSETTSNISPLAAENIALSTKLLNLENRLRTVENLLNSVHQDVHFHHPTKELQYVDMQVVQWEEALKSNLHNVAIPFQAGFTIGAVSSWEFSLSIENEAITANLVLLEEQYNRGALFAGFTSYVLDNLGNVHSQAHALPVNFLDGSGRILHLPNVISLAEIRNSTDGLSQADVFKMRFRLELLGVGHKLYSEHVIQELPTKDTQTVVFDVENILAKVTDNLTASTNDSVTTNNEAKKPLAYTRFVLRHEAWYLNTNWTAEVHKEDENSISLHVILEQCNWSQLYATFNVEVWDLDNEKMIQSQGTPINNFLQDRITIDPLLTVAQLREMYENNVAPPMQFKLQFVTYGSNARYYSDIL